MSNIRRRFVFGEPGIQRREISEIPRGAYARPSPTRCPIATTPRTPQSRSTSAWTSSRGEPGALPRGRRSGKPPAGADGGLKQRNPGIAQTLFRSGMIEQYGTGIPRIKRYCDAEGVKFSYRQTANTTVIRFERTGSQVNDRGNIAADGTAVIAANPSTLEGLN